MEIKMCTSIEQSKKLLELGLNPESADMCYVIDYVESNKYGTDHFKLEVDNYGLKVQTRDNIPCWSLASLLDVLPESITKYIEGESCQKTFHLNLFHSYYHCVSYSFTPSVNDDNTLYCIGRDNWVDACVAMIEKLHELNLL